MQGLWWWQPHVLTVTEEHITQGQLSQIPFQPSCVFQSRKGAPAGFAIFLLFWSEIVWTVETNDILESGDQSSHFMSYWMVSSSRVSQHCPSGWPRYSASGAVTKVWEEVPPLENISWFNWSYSGKGSRNGSKWSGSRLLFMTFANLVLPSEEELAEH